MDTNPERSNYYTRRIKNKNFLIQAKTWLRNGKFRELQIKSRFCSKV